MVDLRIRASAKGSEVTKHLLRKNAPKLESCWKQWFAYFDVGGKTVRMLTPVYKYSDLCTSHVIHGPALILQDKSTIVIEPNCTAIPTADGNISIKIGDEEFVEIGMKLDPIQLAIFGHRFMSIAEQMGRALQRTSVSTNIKERLDFSCAVFGPVGNLVANAPHLPVHLGSMQDAVQYQIQFLENENKIIVDGDVFVSNHPAAGGAHLPDITVITPVFYDGKQIVFWLASRGHHADIGGIAPGSMPPFSTSLADEGCAIKSMYVVKNGKWNENEIKQALVDAGTRNLADNMSDIRAQVASNNKGKELMLALIAEYGLAVVHQYMKYIRQNAETAVRNKLKEIAKKYRYLNENEDEMKEIDVETKINENNNISNNLLMRVNTKKTIISACDFMDDGTPICVKIIIDGNEGSAIFDFTDTGPMVYGNCNAPPSVTKSAVIYCLRCLVDMDIPLNQGCLDPITFIIPENSILNPCMTEGREAAVVGGNVLTSQRVTDVILKAFEACAASQGCMNNVTFGDEMFGYYETIAGGAGAGPDWHGQSGVHTHMTNTRITDPEILEQRYPVCLRVFGLRENSGGKGRFNGGDGCLRFIEFTKPLKVCVLSERRTFKPYGMMGGQDGQNGKNLIRRSVDNLLINIGGKRSYDCQSGDILQLYTPGAGAWGSL